MPPPPLRRQPAANPSSQQCANSPSQCTHSRPAEPFYFLKPTSSYLLPGQGPVELTRGSVIHYEVELGVVIGPKPARAVSAAQAKEHVAGYALAIDYTNRSLQDAAKAQGLPWAAAKGFDTSCPVGEYIPAAEIKDHAKLQLKLRVNGELRQDASTGLMLTPVEKLIEHVSGVMTLEEGDLLLTGECLNVRSGKRRTAARAGGGGDGQG